MKHIQTTFVVLLLLVPTAFIGCEGCDEDKQAPTLQLPFTDHFDRVKIGSKWWTNRPGRWNIEYDRTTKKGHLCAEQARNNHLFLQARLPRNVTVEFDAWAREKDGDVKMELFADGRYNKTGYVFVHGGWNNSLSIIDRLDEHNKNRRVKRNKTGSPIVLKDHHYHWKVTRSGSTAKWYLDGRLYMTYKDPFPLEGKGHEHFGFGNWIAKACYDNVKITAVKEPKIPAKVTPVPPQAVPQADPPQADPPQADPPQADPLSRKQASSSPPPTSPTPRRPLRLKLAIPAKDRLLVPLQKLNRPRQLRVIRPTLQIRGNRHIFRRSPPKR